MPFKATTASRRGIFEIAIICALPPEARAVEALFETQLTNEENAKYSYGTCTTAPDFSKSLADHNAYTTGRIGHHNVVLVHMPGIGVISAAAVAADLKHSFEGIKLVLVVGICGGVPGSANGSLEEVPRKLMLGDVVVGKQVIQYDFGRQYPDGFKRKDDSENNLSRQNPEIRAFVAKLESKRDALEKQTWEYLRSVFESKFNEGSSTGPLHGLRDELMPPTYWHKHHNLDDCRDKKCRNQHGVCEEARGSSCEQLKCDTNQLFTLRRGEPKQKPDIHFGTVASGNTVMRSGEERDLLAAKEKQNIIAFDMEGAGVWDYLPCVIVKGVCDYADSHKNKKWQEYAAMAAAACTKVILEQWPSKHPQQSLENQQEADPRFYNVNSKIGVQSGQMYMNRATFKI